MTKKSVYVSTDYHEKQLQRALLQFGKPENVNLVREALRLAGREELIGSSPECLVRAGSFEGGGNEYKKRVGSGGQPRKGSSTARKPTAKHKAPQNGSRRKGSGASASLGRIFGDDAARIMREAERLSGGSARSKKTVKNKKNRK